MKDAIKGLCTIYPEIRIKVEDIIGEGDLVSTRESWKAKHKGSGKIASGSVMHIFKIREGNVTR